MPTFFYESVHRIEKLISELEQLEFEGKISISREISKLFEQQLTCPFQELKTKLEIGQVPLKGEFVIGLFPRK